MEVERSCWLEYAAKLNQTRGHHGEIRQHIVSPKEPLKGQQNIRHASACFDRLGELPRSALIPSPGILEHLNLRRRLCSIFRGEKNVVVGIRVEWWIEVDEIHAGILDVPPEHIEVVAIVESVANGRHAALY